MAVVETKRYWEVGKNLEETAHPPKDWTRIYTENAFNDGNIWRWFETDEPQGEFCWHHQRFLREDNSFGVVWAFSDSHTAIAFKMKFG